MITVSSADTNIDEPSVIPEYIIPGIAEEIMNTGLKRVTHTIPRIMARDAPITTIPVCVINHSTLVTCARMGARKRQPAVYPKSVPQMKRANL